MPRDRANIFTDIWTDDDWRNLSGAEQNLYLMLLTHPQLSYAGVADWRPGRLAQMNRDGSKAGVEAIGRQLQDKRFIVVDDDTEEVLIRSYIKHDGVLQHPKLAISFVNAYATVSSRTIRMVITHELKKLYHKHPKWKAFEFDRVLNLLAQPSIDMSDLGTTSTLPLTLSAEHSQPLAQPLAQGLAQGLHTATATATATSPSGEGSGERRSPERPLPAGWQPNGAHLEYAKKKNLDLDTEAERFIFHAQANDRRQRNWDAAFRMWLTKAKPTMEDSNPWNQ